MKNDIYIYLNNITLTKPKSHVSRLGCYIHTYITLHIYKQAHKITYIYIYIYIYKN